MATYRFNVGFVSSISDLRDIVFPGNLALPTELRICPFGQKIGLGGAYQDTVSPSAWTNYFTTDIEVYVSCATLHLSDYFLWRFSPQTIEDSMYGYGIFMGTQYEKEAWFPAVPISFSDVMRLCNLFTGTDASLNDFYFTVRTRITNAQVLALVPNIKDTDTVILKGETMTWGEAKSLSSKPWENWTSSRLTIANTHRYNYEGIDLGGTWTDAPLVPNQKSSCGVGTTNNRLGAYYDNTLPTSGLLYPPHTVGTKGGFFWSGKIAVGWGVTSIQCISNDQSAFPYTTTTISCPAQSTDSWYTSIPNGTWTGRRAIPVQMISDIYPNPANDSLEITPSITFKNNFNETYSLPFTGTMGDPVNAIVYKYKALTIDDFEGYRSDDEGNQDINGDYLTFVTTYTNNPCVRDQFNNLNRPTATIEVRTLWGDELVYSETLPVYSVPASGVSYTIGAFELDRETSYKLTVTYTDHFTPIGAVGAEVISTVTTYFEWGKDGKGLAIGKYSETDQFEIYFDIFFPKTCIFLDGTGVEQMADAAALIPYDDTYNIGCDNVQEVIDWLNGRLS